MSIRDDAQAIVNVRRAAVENSDREKVRQLGREYVAEVLALGGRPSRAVAGGRLVDGEYLPVAMQAAVGHDDYLVRVDDGELIRCASSWLHRLEHKHLGSWRRRRLNLGSEPVFWSYARFWPDAESFPSTLALTPPEARKMFAIALSAAMDPLNHDATLSLTVRAMRLPEGEPASALR